MKLFTSKDYEVWAIENGQRRRLIVLNAKSPKTVSFGRSSRMDVQIGKDNATISRHQLDITLKSGKLLLKNRGQPIRLDDKVLDKNQTTQLQDDVTISIMDSLALEIKESKASASGKNYALIVTDSLGQRKIELINQSYSIGKHPTNDIILREHGVSKMHAQLDCLGAVDKPYAIKDLGSKNGVLIRTNNGVKKIDGSFSMGINDEVLLGAAKVRLCDASAKIAPPQRKVLIRALAAVALVVVIARFLTGDKNDVKHQCLHDLFQAYSQEDPFGRAKKNARVKLRYRCRPGLPIVSSTTSGILCNCR